MSNPNKDFLDDYEAALDQYYDMLYDQDMEEERNCCPECGEEDRWCECQYEEEEYTDIWDEMYLEDLCLGCSQYREHCECDIVQEDEW